MTNISATGSISIKSGARYYHLSFSHHGWLAADLVQYLDEIITSKNQEIAILKLLGYTLQIRTSRPPRSSDHWVEIDLKERIVSTNSDLIRKAVDQDPPAPEDPYNPNSLRRVHDVLDQYDFTVELFR